uniref:Uncharacterized protein n=1 Tax=Anguilla anguilla TaxID=7936 RepID=A0A0E9V5M2_ANGAN
MCIVLPGCQINRINLTLSRLSDSKIVFLTFPLC